jgi:L-aspartate oxidase
VSGYVVLHELWQRLVLAELLMEAAQFREESRGGHFRTDVPARQPYWQRHSRQRIGKAIQTEAVVSRHAPGRSLGQNPFGPL